MSDLTRCNFCDLQAIKRENKGKKVTLRDDDGWLRVVVDGKDYGCLFKEITDHCVC